MLARLRQRWSKKRATMYMLVIPDELYTLLFTLAVERQMTVLELIRGYITLGVRVSESKTWDEATEAMSAFVMLDETGD